MSKLQSSNSDGIKLIQFFIRHNKILLYAFIIAIAATVVVTLIMKPSYKSTGIIFPTPTNSPDKILAEPQFGYEVDADWLMQVLKSEIVRDSLNKEFDLVNYFELDTKKQGWMDDFRKEYEDMIDFERTKYMSIEISATTHEPELSANISNYIIDHIDGIREKMFRANTDQTLRHFERIFFEKNDLVNMLIDSIYHLRENNTSESLNLLYAQIKSKQKEVNMWRDELNTIRNKYKFYDLETHVEEINANLNHGKWKVSGLYSIFFKRRHPNN